MNKKELNNNNKKLRLSFQNHVNGLESLKDELEFITKTKRELEKRLQTTVIEKETIFSSLEEALDRIHTLERHIREQDTKLEVKFQVDLEVLFVINTRFWEISAEREQQEVIIGIFTHIKFRIFFFFNFFERSYWI